MPNFRFGITLFPVMSDRGEWTDQVKRAEAAGFEVVTVIDHFGTSGGVFPSLVSAYEAAPSMRVGTMVLNIDFWNPALLAREVATADVLTEGGFELGLGAGWALEDYAAIGMERGPVKDRIAKLDEAIGVLGDLLSGGPVQHDGSWYSVETPELPKPKQARIPIVVGGGSRPILELAGRRADVVSLHRNLQKGAPESWKHEASPEGGPPPDRMAERIGWVRDAAGDRFGELEFHALLQGVVVTDDRRAAAAELGKANGLDPDAILASPHYLVGTYDQMVADLEERRERWGISYWTLVGPGSIETLRPVVERLAGR